MINSRSRLALIFKMSSGEASFATVDPTHPHPASYVDGWRGFLKGLMCSEKYARRRMLIQQKLDPEAQPRHHASLQSSSARTTALLHFMKNKGSQPPWSKEPQCPLRTPLSFPETSPHHPSDSYRPPPPPPP